MEEEKVSDGLVLICSNKFEQISYMHTYNSCQLSSKELIGMVNIGKVWVHKIHEKLRLLKYKEVEKIEIISNEENITKTTSESRDVNFQDNIKVVKSSYGKTQTNNKSINVFNIKI